MKPPELFGVVVLYGGWEIWSGLDNVVENLIATARGDTSDQPASLGFFVIGIPSLVVGVGMFFFEEVIVKLGYRKIGSCAG